MTTYRTGNHWGVTIVREGERTPEGHITGPAELVAVVVNGDQALAERICALLNGDSARWAEAIEHSEAQVRASLSLRTPDLGPGVPVSAPDGSKAAETISGDREAARKVNAARPGIETHTALAVIQVLRVMGWTPPVRSRPPVPRRTAPPSLGPGCICNDPPPTVDKPKNGTASRPPGWACPRHGTVI